MATYENVKFWGEARNGVPSIHSDGMEAPIRTTPYGDVVVAPIMSYYVNIGLIQR